MPRLKMTVFEVNRRIDLLERFVKLLYSYFNNVSYGYQHERVENSTAIESRRAINGILHEVLETVVISGSYPSVTYRDPPALGGRVSNIHLLENLFNLHQWEIHPQIVIDAIDQAIGVYKSNHRSAIIRTFNPFYWFNELIAWTLGIPFRFLVMTGLVSESSAQNSKPLTFFRNLLVFIGTLLTYSVAVVTLAEKFGHLAALKAFLQRVF